MAFASITYCDINTDLLNAYANIDRYKAKRKLDPSAWLGPTSSIYSQYDTGYVEAVFVDGLQYASNATPTTGTFKYTEATDLLEIRITADADPATKTIEVGRDWDGFKTICRNDAQELLENHLAELFTIPFRPINRIKSSYNSEDYDWLLRRCCALLTCYLIISRTDPSDPVAERLLKIVDNPTPEVGEMPGLIQRIKAGDLTLKIQKSKFESGGFSMYEDGSNSATAEWILSGRYTGSEEQVWQVEMDTAGAPGTATWKLSKDNGTDYEKTLQDTTKNSGKTVRILLDNGIYCVFAGSTYTSGDKFTLHLFPETDRPSVRKFGSQRMYR